MADPHHVEVLDGHDIGTVRAYRSGIGLAAVGVAGLSAAAAVPYPDGASRLVVLLAVALIAAHLHLYDKRIRWFQGAAAWTGAALLFAATVVDGAIAPWLSDAGLGFLFVTLSGVALKERYCFRLPLVVGIPISLATALLPMRFGPPWAAAFLLGVGACLLLVLAVAKWRMPLTHDIGNKGAYEV